MENENLSRRDFLRRAGAGTTGAAIAVILESHDKPPPAPVQTHEVDTAISHVPSTYEELRKLLPSERTLLAAATLSGGDAIAYYTPGENGKLQLQQHIDLYPAPIKTDFAQIITYRDDHKTHATDEQVLSSKEYHLPVRTKTGELQGVVVIHAPTGNFATVQTPEQALQKDNMNESPTTRRAKLDMAQYVLNSQSATLSKWQPNPDDNLEAKQKYFRDLRKYFIKVLGDKLPQANHVTGVSDLMMITVDKVINAKEKIIDEPHKKMLEDITVLHDVGKLQASTPFLNKQWRADTPDGRNKYFMGQNHNHPLFSYLALSAYPQEALITASHHHGMLRHTEKEMKEGMGEGYEKFRILKDNVPFDDLPALSKFMRVCDVTQAMTDRGNKPIAKAIGELAIRAGYHAKSEKAPAVFDDNIKHDCNSFDPEYLCMMIANGFFTEYGKSPKGAAKYDKVAVEKISKEVLEAFHWEEKKTEIEARLRKRVADDPFCAVSNVRQPAMAK